MRENCNGEISCSLLCASPSCPLFPNHHTDDVYLANVPGRSGRRRSEGHRTWMGVDSGVISPSMAQKVMVWLYKAKTTAYIYHYQMEYANHRGTRRHREPEFGRYEEKFRSQFIDTIGTLGSMEYRRDSGLKNTFEGGKEKVMGIISPPRPSFRSVPSGYLHRLIHRIPNK